MIPASKFKAELARILQEQGYIEGCEVERRRRVGRARCACSSSTPRTAAGHLRPAARLQARPAQLRRRDGRPAGPRRHGHRDRLDLAGRHDRSRGAPQRRRRRSRRGGLVSRMSRIGKQPIPVPAGVERQIEPELVRVKGPKGELQRAHLARHEGRAGGRPDRRHAPDRPPRASRAARAHPLARREHGPGRHRGLREAPRDPGRRLPRRAEGQGHRAFGRLLAPGHDRGAGRHRVRGAAADPDRRARHPSRSSARSPRDPQGAPARALQGQGHPLRGRVRRSGRSASAHDRRRPSPPSALQAAAAASARRCAAPPSARGCRCSARTGASSPSSSTTSPAARWPPSTGPRPTCAASQSMEQAKRAGELLASARRRPASRPSCSTAAATSTTAASQALAEGAREGGLSF